MKYSYLLIGAAAVITLIGLYQLVFKWNSLKERTCRSGIDKTFEWMISHWGDTAVRIFYGVLYLIGLTVFTIALLGIH